MGRRTGPDDEAGRQRAVELREAGATLEAIKEELAVGSTRLARWLAGVAAPPRARPATDPEQWSEVRQQAYSLRLQGRSYLEIEQALGVPKSTQSGWFRDVPLSEEHRRRLEERKLDGSRSGAAAIRAARVRRTEVLQQEAAAELGEVTDRELFLLGVVAYWCEGSKAKPWAPSESVSFINSDPRLIRLFLRWLERLGYGPDDLSCNISIHENADVDAAARYWNEVTGIPLEQFGRPTLKRHRPKTNRRNTGEDYVGCFIIRVRRSTHLNRRIAGWWAGIAEAVEALPGTLSSDSAVV
jgi:hypothetical protein